MIHLGHSTTTSSKSQVGDVEEKNLRLFTVDPLHTSNGLSITDAMVVKKKGANNYFQITVTDTSSTNVTIKKNEAIGKRQLVSLIVPLPVK